MKEKRGQVGTEYMIIVGFVTIAITSILVLSLFYSNQIKDRLRANNIETFAVQLIDSAETVFFSGEPSKSTVRLYLPENVINVNITQYEVTISSLSSGGTLNIRSFESKVPLSGVINGAEGTKDIILQATSTYVQIN
ncbi:MAG: hypothetical protein AABW51_02060 [Nanoarchaeota archaeon]